MLGGGIFRCAHLLSAVAAASRRATAVSCVRCVFNAASANVIKSPYGEIEVPNIQLYEWAWQNVDKYADRVATECAVTGRRFTYAEARTASQNLAAALVRAGLEPGAVVALLLPNCPEFPIVVLAVNEAGLVSTTCNIKYTPEEISRQLRDSQATVLVTTAELFRTASEAFRLAGLPAPRLAITVSTTAQSAPTPAGATDLRQLLQVSAGTDLPRRERAPEDVAVMPYSSGTTGLAKGVMLTNRNLVANMVQGREVKQQISDVMDGGAICSEEEVIPLVLPMFHIYGLSVVMLQKFSMGAKLVTMPKFEPQLFLDTVANHKATILFVVPPILLFLGGHPSVTKRHLETVRYLVNGAAPAGQMDVDRFLEKAPKNARVLQAYGLTETSPMLLHPEKNTQNQTTVGKPIPSSSVKVVDLQTGGTLGPNQPGEICAKGPQVMLGYHNNPKATAEAIDSDGWLHTGDIGYFDTDLDFYVIDRLKELIKVKGFQVPPAELEEILRSHPAIEDAAVVGVPHERSGEVPKAYVVLKERAKKVVTEKEVAKFVETKVADYKKLAGGVEFVSSIPKNPSGKILRRVLKQQAAR